jgi:hypothetical protein
VTFGEHHIAHGDVLETLRELPDNSFDGLLCDPPYGLRFMGKRWDYDVPSVEVWRECLRVLKPGAALLSFGGSRTFHRIAVGLEDAGFELRDCLTWLYAKGFPKSANVSLHLDKRRDDTEDVRRVCRFLRAAMENVGATSRQLGEAFGVHSRLIDHWAARDTDSQPNLPTWEQWLELKALLAFGDSQDAEVWRLNGRKGEPGEAWKGAEVIGEHEGETPGFTGHRFSSRDALIRAPATELARQWEGYGTALKPAWEPIILARKPLDGTIAANVERWGVGALAIDACRLERDPDDVSGYSQRQAPPGPNVAMSGANYPREAKPDAEGRWPANVALDEGAAAALDAAVGNRPSRKSVTRNGGGNAGGPVFDGRTGTARPDSGRDENGGPSRFFFSAKVSTKEREFGCDALPRKSAGEATGGREEGSAGLSSPRAGAGRTSGARNHHPTLKPLALARWLASMIKPPTPDCALLVPYSGAGSEIVGALQAGWPLVFGIEGDADYIQIAHARIAAWGAAEGKVAA